MLKSTQLDHIGTFQGERTAVSQKYTGEVNRKYLQCKYKYKIIPQIGTPYSIYSNLTVDQVQENYPSSVIYQLK